MNLFVSNFNIYDILKFTCRFSILFPFLKICHDWLPKVINLLNMQPLFLMVTKLSVADIITVANPQVIYGRVFYVRNRYSVHAEKCAIMQTKNKAQLKYCKIIIVKLHNDGIDYATPCEMCQKLLNKYKIDKIYSMLNGKFVRV